MLHMMDEGYRDKEVSWIRETCPQCLQALSTALFSNVIFFVYHKCFGFFYLELVTAAMACLD